MTHISHDRTSRRLSLRECRDVRPRPYCTLWPCYGMHAHNLKQNTRRMLRQMGDWSVAAIPTCPTKPSRATTRSCCGDSRSYCVRRTVYTGKLSNRFRLQVYGWLIRTIQFNG